ncbi:MAG: DJ-1/PfpI family protein [Peptostreptococcaceae bacterium]|nr:DJ-1/PfpI family protein [Peptostreptococcaceae bacterium]
MKKALIFMANGFEEIEALTVYDILTRAEVHADLCSIEKDKKVRGAHGMDAEASIHIDEVKDLEQYDMLITPGGLPGSTNLRDDDRVIEAFKKFYDRSDKYLANICASGIVLDRAGIAQQIKGTCYPGFKSEIAYKEYVDEMVVMDKNVVTSQGPATAIYFALKLVELLKGKAVADRIHSDTLLPLVEKSARK